MSKTLDGRISRLEERANMAGEGIDTILVMLTPDITKAEQRQALDEFYEEHPEVRNTTGIVTLELRRDQQTREVKADLGGDYE